MTAKKNGNRVKNNLSQAEKHHLVEGGRGGEYVHAGVIGTCKNLAKKHQNYMLTLGRNCDFEELESVAYIACVEAANYWCTDGGAKFNTYASIWIKKRLREATDNRREPPRAGNLASPELVASKDNDGADDGDGGDGVGVMPTRKPTQEQWILLDSLSETTREIVYSVVFEGRTPSAVACEKGRPAKDILLIIRNAVQQMNRVIDREDSSIFANCPTDYNHGYEN